MKALIRSKFLKFVIQSLQKPSKAVKMRVASLLMLVSVIGTGYSGAPGTSGSLDEPAIKEQLEKEAKVSGYDPRLSACE